MAISTKLISESNLTKSLQGVKKYIDTKVGEVNTTVGDLQETISGIESDSEEFESRVSQLETKIEEKLESSDLNGYATETYVDNATKQVKDDIVGGASGAYDTLKEIEEYINTHGEAAAALTAQLAQKADKTEIADMLTKTEAAETYQEIGDYLTEEDLVFISASDVNSVLNSVFGVTVE